MCRNVLRLLLLALFVVSPGVAGAQGLLIVVDPDSQVRLPRPIIIYPPHPRPPRPLPPESTYKIQELDIQARLVDQVARVSVSQSFVNTGSRQLEVSFVFPLPYDGAIDSMTLMVDGKEYPAELLPADEARKLYEDIVRKNQDPALLEWMGTGLFKTSVFPVPPGEKRTVTLRYSQLCRKYEGLTDFVFPMSTAKYTSTAVEKVSVRLTLESSEEIKNVYSPTHEVKIKRPDSCHATISYESENSIPVSDFRLLYDVGGGKLSAKVLSYRPAGDEDGYFLLLASPEIKAADKEPPKKTVIFVVDRSGSMNGKKIKQAREALKFVLNNLGEDDLFNIIAYDSEVEAFRPELQRFDDKTREAALGFVEGINAGGSTNIDSALRTALAQITNTDRPNYIVFLTDGLPTAGETNEMKIAAAVKEANGNKTRVFAFGVGYDVNSRLIDRLVRDSSGQSEYVRPDEDIEDRVGSLYRKIESPVLTDVGIEFVLDEHRAEHGEPINRVYPKGRFDLFAGEQLVVVGRYKRPGAAKVVVSGKVNDADGGTPSKFDFPATLVEKSADDTHAFVEKLWAVRRVGEIIDELDLKGHNDELVTELVGLATKHGILTPYTSFIADENTNIHDRVANSARTRENLRQLEVASGAGGFGQRRFKGEMQKAKLAGSPSAMPAGPADGMGRSGGFGYGPGMGMEQGMGGMGGGMAGKPARGRQAAPMGEPAPQADEAAPRQEVVRQVGNRAFYRRNDQWVDSTLTEKQQENPRRIKQFSDEYFALAKRFGRDMTQYLAFDEPVIVNLGGEAYLVEP